MLWMVLHPPVEPGSAYQEFTAGRFSQSVSHCKVCNREQYLTSLYALLKKQTTHRRGILTREKSALRVASAKGKSAASS
jgi:hypothetical protein